MTPFSQEAWACRCEWGTAAVTDKFIAGDLDVSACVPRFDGVAFVAD